MRRLIENKDAWLRSSLEWTRTVLGQRVLRMRHMLTLVPVPVRRSFGNAMQRTLPRQPHPLRGICCPVYIFDVVAMESRQGYTTQLSGKVPITALHRRGVYAISYLTWTANMHGQRNVTRLPNHSSNAPKKGRQNTLTSSTNTSYLVAGSLPPRVCLIPCQPL